MGIFKFLKSKRKKTDIKPKRNDSRLKALEGKENEVHFVKIDKFIDGEVVAQAFFPEFQNDLFGVEILKDDFTNEITTQPFFIHSRKSDKVMFFSRNSTTFKIGIRNKKDRDFLTLEAYQKEIKFLVGDKLSLLFENEEILELEVKKKGSRKEKDSDGVLFETEIPINEGIVVKLKNNYLAKWKYQDYKNDISFSNSFDLEKKNLIQEMAIMMDLIKNVSLKGL